MKTLSFFAILIFTQVLYGQYDYFRWKDEVSNIPTAKISIKSGLTSDIFNRCYYIDQLSKKVSNQYGTLISSAQIARSNSNLIYKNDPINGDGVYYIGSNNKVYAFLWDFNTNSWQLNTQYASIAATVSSNSFIDVKNKDEIFYVNSKDNRISSIKRNGLNLEYGTLNTGALPAISSTNIVHFANNVYYIANNGKLSFLTWNGSSWSFTNLNSDIIAVNSKIKISPIGDQIFYVRNSDKRICSYWNNGGQSGFSVLDETSVPAMTGTDINVNTEGDQVSYIGIDGNIHLLNWDNCRWLDNRLNLNCGISPDFNTFCLADNGQMFYFNGTNIMSLSRNIPSSNMVYRKGTHLELNGNDFKAKIADYSIAIYRRDGQFFIGPDPNSDSNNSNWVCLTSGTCSTILDNDFQTISEAGFNSIRFNGLTVSAINDTTSPNLDSKLYVNVWEIPANYTSGVNLPFPPTKVDAATIETELFNLFNSAVNKAGSYNLKVNFFVGEGLHKSHNIICHDSFGNYLNHLADNFKNNSNILMYSLLLEADAGSTLTDKNYICSTINSWYDKIRQVDKNHLVSLGVIGPFSIANFDPGIMNVDVLTFHIYPDLHNQTYSNYNFNSFIKDLKWVSNIMYKNIKKPWIIGETGVIGVPNPANYPTPHPSGLFNLVLSYQQQRDFGIMSLQNVFSAGASGYGWWQYKDASGSSNTNINVYDYGVYFGLVDPFGVKKDIIVSGNSIFNTVPIESGCNSSTDPIDYFNHSNNFSYELNGYIYDSSGSPINDAYISFIAPTGLESPPYAIQSTFSNSNGYFRLKSEYPITEIDILAVGKYTLKKYSPMNWASHIVTSFSCQSPYGMVEPESNQRMYRDIYFANKCQVFPNPSSGIFNISFEKELLGDTDIHVYNLCGEIVLSKKFVDLRVEKIDMSNFISGLYIVKINNENYSETIKIIKE